MALLPILVAPDPRLKKIAKPVAAVDASVRKLMDDMLETMYNAPGIGLAAPQVGVSKRVLVLDVEQPRGPDDEDLPDVNARRGKPICFVNPEIVWSSEEPNVYDEGCLSLPGLAIDCIRARSVVATGFTMYGEPVTIDGSDLLARAIQHETDHLDGILFIDRLDREARKAAMKTIRESEWFGADTQVRISPHPTSGFGL